LNFKAKMARQTIKARRNEHEVNSTQRRISARISGVQEVSSHYVPQEASSIQRPVREVPNLNDAQHKKSTKIQPTVSAAGIFKKKPKVNPRGKKHHRRREPEPDSFADFQGMKFLKPLIKHDADEDQMALR
jgi:hypothetical protein